VTGVLVPSAGYIRVTPLQSGIVEKIFVAEGGVVRRGAVIAQVQLLNTTDAGDPSALLLRSLTGEQKAVAEQLSANRSRIASAQEEAVEELKTLESDLVRERARVELALKQKDLAETGLARREKLVKDGWVTALTIEQARSAVLAAESQLLDGRQRINGLRREIFQTRQKLRQGEADLALQASSTAQQHESIEQRKIAAQREQSVLITAPVAGTVSALAISVGQTVSPNFAAAVITPSGVPLVAQLQVPSKAVGFIVPGQLVSLKYDAFPYQTFGVQHATIVEVSNSPFAPSDLNVPAPPANEPLFRVKAKIQSQTIRAYSKAIRLLPGTTFSADIAIREQSLLRWIMDPVYAVGRR
jgi:membrane fusion protein